MLLTTFSGIFWGLAIPKMNQKDLPIEWLNEPDRKRVRSSGILRKVSGQN